MALSRRQFLSVAAAGAGAILVAPRIVFANVETDRRFVFVIQRRGRRPEHRRPVCRRVCVAARPARNRHVGRDAARRHVRTTSVARADRAVVPRRAGAVRSRDCLAVSRPLAFRRAERARDGRPRAVPGEGRLAEPARRAAAGHARKCDRVRADRAAARGTVQAASYAPSGLPAAPDDLLARVSALYEADAQLGPLWQSAMDARGLAGDAMRGRIQPVSASSPRRSSRATTARASR